MSISDAHEIRPASIVVPVELPTELTDLVLELCNDRPTWLTCSLVCRAWIPASRAMFFSKLMFLSNVATEQSLLIALLRDNHATLPRYLRHICISGPKGDTDGDGNTDTQAPDALWSALLRSGCEIATLKLDWAWSSSSRVGPSLAALIVQSTQSLQCLDFHEISPLDVPNLMEWVSRCSNLTKLTIVCDCRGQSPSPPSPSMLASASLQSFSIDTDDVLVPLFVDWLVRSQCYPKHLSIRAQNTSELKAFVIGLSPSMLQAVVSLKIVLDDDARWELYLPNMQQLSELTIEFECHHYPGRETDLRQVLDGLPSDCRLTLLSVTFKSLLRSVLIRSSMSDLDAFFATHMDEGCLACADFHYLGSIDKNVARSQYFPKCSQQQRFELVLKSDVELLP